MTVLELVQPLSQLVKCVEFGGGWTGHCGS